MSFHSTSLRTAPVTRASGVSRLHRLKRATWAIRIRGLHWCQYLPGLSHPEPSGMILGGIAMCPSLSWPCCSRHSTACVPLMVDKHQPVALVLTIVPVRSRVLTSQLCCPLLVPTIHTTAGNHCSQHGPVCWPLVPAGAHKLCSFCRVSVEPSMLASWSCCSWRRSRLSTVLQAATAASTAQYVGFSAMLFMLVRQGRLDLRDLGSMPSMAEVVPFAKVSARFVQMFGSAIAEAWSVWLGGPG